MRILVIANPVAGGGKGKDKANRLAHRLRERDHDVDVMFTTASGDARQRAADFNGECDVIAIVGGDGTVNEVINGLGDPGAVPIGQLPMGTANILARELGLPFSTRQLADVIEGRHTRRLDMGIANGRRFLAVCSCGFDAMVVESIAKRRRGSLGFLGYPGPILSTLRRYRPPVLTLAVNGETIEGQMAVISNIRNYAAFFSITDKASCDSGQLDAVLFRKAGLVALAGYAVAALRRVVSNCSHAEYRQADRFTITAEPPTPFEVDGDFAGHSPVEITVQPQTVQLLVPRPAPKG